MGDNMTPNAQRVAIARACPQLIEWHDDKPYWRGGWSAAGEGNEHFAEFDPLNDLNAIRDAEKLLTVHQLQTYLRYIVPDEQQWIRYPINAYWRLRHASAAECLSALVRTLNLWDDTQ